MQKHAPLPLGGSAVGDHQSQEQQEQQQQEEQQEHQHQLLHHAESRPDQQLRPHHQQHECLPPKLQLKLELEQQQRQQGEQHRRQQQERYDAAVAAAAARAARATVAAQQQQLQGKGQGHKQGGVRQEQEVQEEAPKVPLLARIRRRVLSVQQLWIYPFTHYKPTNQVMLCYRTLFQDLRRPGANDDYLAARFRDHLMPLRGWVHRKAPALLHINEAIIQGPMFGCPGVMTYLDARTRWLDEEVVAATRGGGGATQVVILAAGYDTRAYRLAAPGVSYFELDLPYASETKRRLVQATLPEWQFPRPTYIAADLSCATLREVLLAASAAAANTHAHRQGPQHHQQQQQGLPGAPKASSAGCCGGFGGGGGGSGGAADTDASAAAPLAHSSGAPFDPRRRTLFTVEGLLYYLDPSAVRRLLAGIREVAAPGSRLAFDYLHADVFDGRRYEPGYETLRLTVANKGEPFLSALDPATLGSYLQSLGWRLTYQPDPREVAAAMYPNKKWRSWSPLLPPFYGFATAEAI